MKFLFSFLGLGKSLVQFSLAHIIQKGNSECLSSYLWAFSESLDESGLGLRILQLNGFDSAKVVEVSRVLII